MAPSRVSFAKLKLLNDWNKHEKYLLSLDKHFIETGQLCVVCTFDILRYLNASVASHLDLRETCIIMKKYRNSSEDWIIAILSIADCEDCSRWGIKRTIKWVSCWYLHLKAIKKILNEIISDEPGRWVVEAVDNNTRLSLKLLDRDFIAFFGIFSIIQWWSMNDNNRLEIPKDSVSKRLLNHFVYFSIYWWIMNCFDVFMGNLTFDFKNLNHKQFFHRNNFF